MIQKKSLERLTTNVINYLQKLSYSASRISQYRSAWRKVATFMKENDLHYFNATLGETFIYNLIVDRSYDVLDGGEKDIIYCTKVLIDFLEIVLVKFKRCQKFRD